MISGVFSSSPIFLTDLNATEQRISRDDQQISSGVDVSVPSDDPADVPLLLDDQNQVAQITQLVTNLQQQQTITQTADGALQTAASLLNQLISLGTEGATATATPTSNAVLAQQVQQIQQQLVAIANTSVDGQYIFGGDDPSTLPYTYDGSSSPNNDGVIGVTPAPTNTMTITGLDGSSITPGLTAGQIFEGQSGGPSNPVNVFQAVYQLGTALVGTSQTNIQTAVTTLQSAADYLNQCAAVYGDNENWLQQQITTANSRSTLLTGEIGNLRDTDVANVATDMSQAQVALEAALSAEASLPTKSLFSYLG